jgi:nitroreductase
MEFSNVIKDRRSVREYTDARVERQVVDHLINTAILAPSAMNLQPWAFAALLDRARIEDYAHRAKNWLLTKLAESTYPPSIRQMLEDPNFVLFYHAPALILVIAKSSEDQAKEDCCLAAQTLMLAARDEGLGTCWIGLSRPWFNLASSKRELGLPEHYHIVAPIVLGYPKAWPETHGRNPGEILWLG